MESLIGCLGTILVLAIIITPFVIWLNRSERRKIEEAFAERQELSEREFYEKYFEAKGIPFYVVRDVRKVLEDVLLTDLSRLYATDDFSTNLNFFFHYNLSADVEIVIELEERFEIKISDSEAEKLKTVDEIVSFVWQKIQQKENT